MKWKPGRSLLLVVLAAAGLAAGAAVVRRQLPGPRSRPRPAAGPSAAALLSEGERLLAAGDRRRAWDALDRARAIAQQTGDHEAGFAALLGLGDAEPPGGDRRLATAALVQAFMLAPPQRADAVLARLEFRRGVAAAHRNDLAQAKLCFERTTAAAQRSGDRKMEARGRHALGNVACGLWDMPAAAAHYRAALRLGQAAGDRRILALSYRDLAIIEQTLGQTAEVIPHFEAAVAVSRGMSDPELTERLLNSLGSYYVDRGAYGLALRVLHEASRLGTTDRSELSYLNNNLGIVYGQTGQDELAETYFEHALRLADAAGDDYARMRTLNNLGACSTGSGAYDRARASYQRALRLAENTGDREAAVGLRHNLAEIYELEGDYDLAAATYRRSLSEARSLGKKALAAQALAGLAHLHLSRHAPAAAAATAVQAAATARQADDRETFWRAETSLGTALRRLGRRRAARRAFSTAIAAIEEQREQTLAGETVREAFLEPRLGPYAGMIALAVESGDAADALAQAERAKSRVLLDVLRGRSDPAAQLAPEERATDRRLRAQLAALNRDIFRGGTEGGAGDALRRRRDQARRELEAFTMPLYAAHPDLKLRAARLADWQLAAARPLLARPGTVLLEYAVLSDRTYLFVVTAGSHGSLRVRCHPVPLQRARLAREVESFRRHLAARDLRIQQEARRLDQLLLAAAGPALRHATTLVIVPDGPLWDLPFQALAPSASEVLLDRCALSYGPSLTFLAELATRRHPAADPAPNLFAVGDPALPVRASSAFPVGLEPLPEAAREVAALADLYGRDHGAVYTAALASEARVKAEAGRFRVLHFSTHALLDDRNPLYSSLVLSQTAPSGGDDGLLEAWEIVGLHLHADLVVLSACQTARGRPRGGEGMIGMTWAFTAAGSAATLASQWEVDSASTGLLMVELHRGWLQGLTKAEALRRAALAVRRQSRYRHPFYWAGFVLVGDGT